VTVKFSPKIATIIDPQATTVAQPVAIAIQPTPMLAVSGGGNGSLDGHQMYGLVNPVDGQQFSVDITSLVKLENSGFIAMAGTNQNRYFTNLLTPSYGSFLNSVGSQTGAVLGSSNLQLHGGAEASALMASVDHAAIALPSLALSCVAALAQLGFTAVMAAESVGFAVPSAAIAAALAANECGGFIAAHVSGPNPSDGDPFGAFGIGP
jgi:hypothetical protein